jgi:hypothetical protein
MTRTQFKKKQALTFNLRRAERLAYEMDSKLFPAPKSKQGRLSDHSLMVLVALAASI